MPDNDLTGFAKILGSLYFDLTKLERNMQRVDQITRYMSASAIKLEQQFKKISLMAIDPKNLAAQKQIVDLKNKEALTQQRIATAKLKEAQANRINLQMESQRALIQQRLARAGQSALRTQQMEADLQNKMAAAELRRLLIAQRRQQIEQQNLRLAMMGSTGSVSGTSSLATMSAAQANMNRYFGQMESRAQQHKTFMEKTLSGNYFAHHLNFMITAGALFATLYTFSEALVQVEKGMKGLQTVLPTIAHDQQAYNETSKEAIDLMQKYGASVDEVFTSARSLGRMYKDVNTVMGLTNNSILLNVIDNVNLEDAVKANEAALSIYGDTLENTNEVMAFSGKLMDSLTRLSHESMAQASDLIQILQQAGGAAKEARVELDQLLGLGASAVRATGLQGAGGNLGRMLRTVFVQLSAPTKSVEEDIEKIGVKMRETTGELRNAYEVILDLSLATKDATVSQEDLNNAILRASSGKFQYSKLAALMGQFDEIVQNTARSIHSQGITMQMAAQQLDTIERKARMFHATLVDMFSGAGDKGLRSTIKDLIDSSNQFVMGLNNVSAGAINASLGLGALLLGGRMILGIFNKLIPIMGAMTGINAQIAATSNMAAAGQISLATATNISSAAMSKLAATTAIATAGLSLLIGGLVYMTYKSGDAERKQNDLNNAYQDSITLSQQKVSQYQQEASFIEQMAGYHKKLKDKIDSGTLSEAEAAEVKKNLIAVEEALEIALGEEGEARLKAAGYAVDAIDAEIVAIKNKTEDEMTALRNTIKLQEQQTQAVIDGALKRIRALKEEGAAIRGILAMENVAAKTATGIYDWQAGSHEKAADFFEGIGADRLAEINRNNAEAYRKMAQERTDTFNKEVEDATQKQITEQERIIAEAEAKLLQNSGFAFMPGGFGLDDFERDFGDGDDETKGGADSNKNPLDFLKAYETQLNQTSQALNILNAQEQINLATQRNQIPTLDQATTIFGNLKDQIANNYEQMAILEKENVLTQRRITQTGDATGELTDKLLSNKVAWQQNRLSIIETRNQMSDLVTQYLRQGREIDRDLALKDLETQRKAAIKVIEDARDAFTEASNVRIEALQKELELLNEQNDLLKEQQRLEEAQARVEEARTRLSNIQAERNVRILNTSGQWEWISDPAKLADATKELEEAESNLAETREEIALNARRWELQNTIEHEQDKQKIRLEEYATELKQAEEQWAKKIEQATAFWEKQLSDEQLNIDAMNIIHQGGWNEALVAAENYFRELKARFDSGSGSGSGSSGGEFDRTVDDILNDPNTSPAVKDAIEKTRAMQGYDKGGPIYYDQIARVHQREYVLNAPTVDKLGGFAGVERFVAAVNMPQLFRQFGTGSGETKPQVANYHVDRSTKLLGDVRIQHVYDVDGFLRNLSMYAAKN